MKRERFSLSLFLFLPAKKFHRVALSSTSATICDRKQTSGSDRAPMRIQDRTDCHLSRLSRSLMTRTAFGCLLLMPSRAPGTDSLYYSLLLRTPSAFRLHSRPILSSCFYLRNDRAICLSSISPASLVLSWRCDG